METADGQGLDIKRPKSTNGWIIFIFSVILGFFLAFATVYLWTIPEARASAYAQGLEFGKTVGDSVGHARGVSDGRAIERIEAESLRQTVASAMRKKRLARERAMRRKRQSEKPIVIQNWHVDRFVLGEPIP